MKGLGERLRRTVGDAPAPPAPAPERLRADLERYGRLRARAQAAARGEAGEPVAFDEAIGGEPVATPFGDAWVVDTRLPLAARHGSRRLDAFYGRALDHLPALVADERLAGRVPEEALFLDIEATGLDHGAGTHAFLIGLGYRDGDALVVRQLLMREPAEEQAVLQLLVERLDRHPLLVSFNGKSYDLTVLQTRLVIQRFYTRRDCDLKVRPHLDLLHLSRNVYRGCWPDTRLGTLEREVLGFAREDDVPGHLVPTCWFHFLRTGDAGPLAGVMLHNLHDVLSMVTLADRLAADAAPVPDPTRDARVSANLARLLDRRGRARDAARLLAAWVDDPPPADAAAHAEGLEVLARAARRAGDRPLQGAALDRLHALRPDDADVLLALAQHEERARRDVPRAAALARRAHALAPTEATRRRLDRLEARLARLAPARTASDEP